MKIIFLLKIMVAKIINENMIENKNENIINFDYFDIIMFRNRNRYINIRETLTAENLNAIHHAVNRNKYEY